MMSQTELRQQITNEIIASLQQGIVPWKRPWNSDKNCGRSRNAVSKRFYNGINILLLALHNYKYGFNSRNFATYRQWESLGGQVMRRPAGVRSGQWGCKIILWKSVKKKVKNSDDEDTFFVMRQFTVFNVDQVEGDHLDHLRVGFSGNSHYPDVSIQDADELIEASGAQIVHGGNNAHYRPTNDSIQMPHKHQFEGTAYYETLFHEMSHWTEHPERLNWDRSEEGNSYAMGELIAEMASCFVCTELGIPLAEGIDNHAAYLGGWLKALKDDPSFIFKASTQASKVTDYLLSFSSTHAEEREPLVVV